MAPLGPWATCTPSTVDTHPWKQLAGPRVATWSLEMCDELQRSAAAAAPTRRHRRGHLFTHPCARQTHCARCPGIEEWCATRRCVSARCAGRVQQGSGGAKGEPHHVATCHEVAAGAPLYSRATCHHPARSGQPNERARCDTTSCRAVAAQQFEKRGGAHLAARVGSSKHGARDRAGGVGTRARGEPSPPDALEAGRGTRQRQGATFVALGDYTHTRVKTVDHALRSGVKTTVLDLASTQRR